MKARQLFGLAAATVTVAAGVIVGMPGIALAHTPNVDDTCTGLIVNLTSYETISGPTKNNKVTVTIDNSINVDVSDANFFDGSFNKTYSWAQYESHTWTVVIDANINATTNKTTYDKTFSGTQQACQQPQPTTVAWTPTDGTCANPSGGSLAVSYNADKATYAGSAAGSYVVGASANGQFTAKPGFTITGNAGPFSHQFVVSDAPCEQQNNPNVELVKVTCKSWTADFSNEVKDLAPGHTAPDAAFDLVIDGDVDGAEHIVLKANETAHREGSFLEDTGIHTVAVGEDALSFNSDCAPNEIVPPHLSASYDCVNEKGTPKVTDSQDAEHYVVGEVTFDAESNTYSVTVTPAEGFTFGQAADNEDGTVTLTATFVVTTNCEEVAVTPQLTPPTCANIGSLVLPESQFFTWTANEDGTYTATAKEGFRLVGTRTFGPFDIAQLTGEQCVVPKIDLAAFSPVCQADIPYIHYEIKVSGTPNTTATITLIDNKGQVAATYTNMPFTGDIIYPGASTAPDWPGWKLVGGSWVIDPSDEHLRQGLSVKVEVNPTATTNVLYPASTEACAGPPQVQSQAPTPPVDPAPQLPSTGSGSGRLAILATGLVLVGGGLRLVRRPRRI